MVLAADRIVPDIPIKEDPDIAEKREYENWKIVTGLLSPGVSGSFTVAGHVFTVTKGIITNIT